MTLDDDINKLGKEQPFFDEAELSQVLKRMDEDVVDHSTKMSTIDFNSRLNRAEINASLICDELIRFGLLSKGIGISRQKKRLSVSLDGKGREEKVRIVSAEREGQRGGGFMNGFANLFKQKQ